MSEITVRELACGMPLIVEQIDGVGSLAFSWCLPAGSATDEPHLQGLCAMWSELIFRGAGDLDARQQADALDRLGLNRSSHVGAFHLQLAGVTIGARFVEALPRIVDMIRHPRFDEQAIEPTRDLSIQSIESLADDPQDRAGLAARERFFPAPLNRSGLGTLEGLAAITRKDLVDRWSARARPGGSVLAVAGDADPDAIARRLDELLDGWTGKAGEPTWGGTPDRGTYHHIDDESEQVQIVVVHEAPPEPHDDSKLERIVHAVLSGGMAARLFTEVREKRGLCYAVSASYGADRDFGRSTAYVGTTPERAQESLDVVLQELSRVNGPSASGGGISAAEFERAMIGLKSSLVFSGESTGARSASLAVDWHRIGRPRSLDEINDDFARIKLDDVNAYLERRTIGSPTIVTVGKRALSYG